MNSVVSVASLASAAAVASPIPAAVVMPAAAMQEEDELIFELARQHETLVMRYREWDVGATAREDAIEAEYAPPAALKIRRGEISTFGRILRRRDGVWKNYWDRHCSLRVEFLQKGTSPVDKGGLADLRALSKSEHKRLREIVDAAKAEWDERREDRAYYQSHRKIEVQRSRRLGLISKLERKIAKAPAKTLAGMHAKLRCSLWIDKGVYRGYIEDDDLIQSIIRDVYRMGDNSTAAGHLPPI